MPPLLYLATVRGIERFFTHRYTYAIEAVCTGDAKVLFDGRAALKDRMVRNVDQYLSSLGIWGTMVQISVDIRTKNGEKLYPANIGEDAHGLMARDPNRIAEENYRLLSSGLVVNVHVALDTESPLSLIIISAYVIIAIGILFVFYRMGEYRLKKDAAEAKRLLDELMSRGAENEKKLSDLAEKRTELEHVLNDTKKKLNEASRSEDGLIEEILSLEKKIEQNEMLQKIQQEEIDALKSTLNKIESERKDKPRQSVKGEAVVAKRFKALYKNIAFHNRVFSGFQDLEEGMKLKCEEIIHLLNDDPDLVVIKRKVFGKKNRETVFEVNFAYSGRLYFRKLKSGIHEVLAVGTKNTQERELEFLDKL
jgi:hypothetical protein